MKRKTVIFLIVLVACGMAASYVTRLIVRQRSARMTMAEKWLLRDWVNLVGAYPDMQDLPSRADAARSWAHTAANNAEGDPAGLTPAQAELIRNVARNGLNAGAVDTKDRHEFTWKRALAGSFPARQKKPSACLNPHFLDQYPSEPLYDEKWGLPRPEEVTASRHALEQLTKNRDLVELIDECWQIGYEAGCPLADDW